MGTVDLWFRLHIHDVRSIFVYKQEKQLEETRTNQPLRLEKDVHFLQGERTQLTSGADRHQGKSLLERKRLMQKNKTDNTAHKSKILNKSAHPKPERKITNPKPDKESESKSNQKTEDNQVVKTKKEEEKEKAEKERKIKPKSKPKPLPKPEPGPEPEPEPETESESKTEPEPQANSSDDLETKPLSVGTISEDSSVLNILSKKATEKLENITRSRIKPPRTKPGKPKPTPENRMNPDTSLENKKQDQTRDESKEKKKPKPIPPPQVQSSHEIEESEDEDETSEDSSDDEEDDEVDEDDEDDDDDDEDDDDDDNDDDDDDDDDDESVSEGDRTNGISTTSGTETNPTSRDDRNIRKSKVWYWKGLNFCRKFKFIIPISLQSDGVKHCHYKF